jgi:hypothetical protein
MTINKCIVTNNLARGHYGSSGGGVYSVGTLTVNNSTVSQNKTVGIAGGGGIYSGGSLAINNSMITGNGSALGGGVAVRGPLTINKSTLTANTASQGGGLYDEGFVVIINSTLSGNTAVDEGGGGVSNVGTLAIYNSTVTGNSAVQGGDIFNNGGGAFLQNSIVANSLKGGNCSGAITSFGHNLSSDNTCNLSGAGDFNNVDPKLGPLQNNGGPTPTHALLSGSPAIDSGNPTGCTDSGGSLLKTDQRGQPRPDKEDIGGCDIGAYESQTD